MTYYILLENLFILRKQHSILGTLRSPGLTDFFEHNLKEGYIRGLYLERADIQSKFIVCVSKF